MSNSFSAPLEQWLLQHVFGGIAYPAPSVHYVAAFTVAPQFVGGGTEVTGGGYVRMQVTFTAPQGTPPSVQNAQPVQWAAATASWGIIGSVAIMDAATAGNILASALLVDPADGVTPVAKQIDQGDIFRIGMGALSVGFTSPSTPPISVFPGTVMTAAVA